MEWQEVGGRMWKSLRLRTKIEAIAAIFFIVLLVTASVASVSRTITDSSDSVETYIRNSNGKYWPATGANLQTAINDLTSGGTVYVPVGTIDLSSDLTINNKVWLKGSGIGNTVLRQADGSTTHSGVIRCHSKNNFTISDLTIDGNLAGVAEGYNCIDIKDCSKFIVRDISIINPTRNGICIYSSSFKGIISNIFCEHSPGTAPTAGYHALDIGYSRQIAINNIVIQNFVGTTQAIDFAGIRDSTISNINVNNSAMAMKVTGNSASPTENCTFTNLVFKEITGGEGIKIEYTKRCSFNNIQVSLHTTSGESQAFMVYTSSGITKFINLNNIYIDHSNGTGLTVTADNVSINNIFIYNTTKNQGLYLSGDDITISNLHIRNAYSSGVKITGTLRVTIIGGIIDDNYYPGGYGYGIDMEGTKYTVLEGLHIFNNNGDGIETGGGTANSNYTITNCYFYGNAKAIDTGATDNYYIIIGNTCYGDAIDDNNAAATKVIANNIATIT